MEQLVLKFYMTRNISNRKDKEDTNVELRRMWNKTEQGRIRIESSIKNYGQIIPVVNRHPYAQILNPFLLFKAYLIEPCKGVLKATTFVHSISGGIFNPFLLV